jgi:predicted transcriptional regulator
MGSTLTVRIDDELAAWLEETARKRGISKGKLVRDQIQMAKTRCAAAEPAFMRLAGTTTGPKDLSTRKGFSRR